MFLIGHVKKPKGQMRYPRLGSPKPPRKGRRGGCRTLQAINAFREILGAFPKAGSNSLD